MKKVLTFSLLLVGLVAIAQQPTPPQIPDSKSEFSKIISNLVDVTKISSSVDECYLVIESNINKSNVYVYNIAGDTINIIQIRRGVATHRISCTDGYIIVLGKKLFF